MQSVNPVDFVVQVERVPSELIGYLVQLARIWIDVVGTGLSWLERGVRSGGKDPVEPGLLVLAARCSESCAGQLLVVEAIRSLLR